MALFTFPYGILCYSFQNENLGKLIINVVHKRFRICFSLGQIFKTGIFDELVF